MIRLLLPVLCLLTAVASAKQFALVVGDQPLPVSALTAQMGIMVDPTATLGIDEVMADDAGFFPQVESVPSFGFTRAAVWSKFTVRSESQRAQNLIVQLEWARLSHATWYAVANGSVERSLACGALDATERTNRMPTLELTLPPGAERTVYLRCESDTAILLPLRIGDAKGMRHFERRQVILHALTMGFSAGLGFLCLLLGWMQRSRPYLCLSLVAFAYVLYLAIYHGYIPLMWPAVPLWIEREGFGLTIGLGYFGFVMLNGAFLGRVGMSGLELWLQRLAIGLVVASMVICLLFEFRLAIRLVNPMALIGILAGLAVAVSRGKPRREDLWFVAAWGGVGLLVLWIDLQLKAVIPTFVPFQLLQLLMLPCLLTIFFLAVLVRQRADELSEQLRAAERQAHELLGNISAGTYEASLEMDAQGTVGPRFRFLSPQFVEMFGVAREALLGDPSILASRIHPEDAARLAAANTEAFATGKAFHWDGRVVVDGVAKWFVIHSNPRVAPDGVTVWDGVVNDITARMEAERRLADALENEKRLRAEADALRREAEKADAAKGLFLAKMSHEIRTPLSALVSLSQAMWMRGEQQQLDPDFTEFLNRVRSGGQYLNLLLRNVLGVSAAKSGRVPVSASEFYLADWVEGIRNILDPIAEYHCGRIEWIMPADDEARCRTDPMRLTQIALNLGENALKFGTGKGIPVRIAVDKVGERLRLVVEDRGPGMAPDMWQSVFAEYSQADNRVSPRDEGVGLGLAVVRINTDLLGGTVHVDSLDPHGSRFWVEIPLLG